MEDLAGLSKRHFLIVGVGSLGSALAEMLVRSGTEHRTLIDPAKFEEQQRERHVLAHGDIGTHKVEGMEERLQGIASGRYLVNYAPFRADMIYTESADVEFRGGEAMRETRMIYVLRHDAVICTVKDSTCRKAVNAAIVERKTLRLRPSPRTSSLGPPPIVSSVRKPPGTDANLPPFGV